MSRVSGESLVHTLRAVESLAATPEDRAYFSLHRARYELVLREIERIAAGRNLCVLDVGCYPYQVSAALELAGHTVFGVASEHEPVSRANVAVLNVERDPIPHQDNTFDLVVFNEILEHLPQSPVLVLQELCRVTQTGGSLILTTPNIARLSNRVKLLLGRSVMYSVEAYFYDGGHGNNIYYRHNREYTLAELRRVVGYTGWQVQTGAYVSTLRHSWGPGAGAQAGADLRWVVALKSLSSPAKRLVPSLRDTLFLHARKPA
jgi:SAM-dependent methyltransferase